MIVLGKPEKVLDTKGVNHMENEMLDQMHKKLVWKITIQFIWILCITAMINRNFAENHVISPEWKNTYQK